MRRCKLCGRATMVKIVDCRPHRVHSWNYYDLECPEMTPLVYHYERSWWQKLLGIWPEAALPEARIIDNG